MGEIAEQCQGVKLVLVALKCDLREKHGDDDDDVDEDGQPRAEKKPMIDYQQGLAVARRIQALRYLGKQWLCSTRLDADVEQNAPQSAIVESMRRSLRPQGWLYQSRDPVDRARRAAVAILCEVLRQERFFTLAFLAFCGLSVLIPSCWSMWECMWESMWECPGMP